MDADNDIEKTVRVAQVWSPLLCPVYSWVCGRLLTIQGTLILQRSCSFSYPLHTVYQLLMLP